MGTFKSKVVVITGGNSGIGYATAKEFIAQKATVIITGKRKEALEKAATEIGAKSILADQSNLQDIDNLVTEVKNNYGKIDVLFLNAGVASFSPIEFTKEDQFDTLVNTNFKGSFFTLQKFISILNDGASVVFLTASITGMNMPNSAVYSASKSAISHLAKIAAIELAPKKVRVNIVSPGPTMTEIGAKMGMDEATVIGMKEKIVSQVPLAKMGVPEDVAKMVAYLSDHTTSSFITGSEFFIDGGIAL